MLSQQNMYNNSEHEIYSLYHSQMLKARLFYNTKRMDHNQWQTMRRLNKATHTEYKPIHPHTIKYGRRL